MFDMAPPPKLWLPPKAAIIRPHREIRRASFLPGTFPAGAIAARSPVTSISFQDSATSVSNTITAPAGVIAGDLLVLYDAAVQTSPATVVPTGFTSIVNTTDTAVRAICSLKLAAGTEASSTITGMNDDLEGKILLVFRPNVPALTYAAFDSAGQITNGNPTSQTVDASGGTPPLIVFGAYLSTGTVNPRTMSPTKDSEIGISSLGKSNNQYIAWKIYNSAPANVSVDMDDEGSSNTLQSFYIQVT